MPRMARAISAMTRACKVHSSPFAPLAKLWGGTALTVTGTGAELVDTPAASLTTTETVEVPAAVGMQVTVGALTGAHPWGSPLQL